MTGAPDRGPLRLHPPSLLSDERLADRLAALARASMPTAPLRARRRWHLPVAGAAIALATAGATFAADQARQHEEPPRTVVPARHFEPASAPTSAPATEPTPTDSRAGATDDNGDVGVAATRSPARSARGDDQREDEGTDGRRPSARATPSDEAREEPEEDAGHGTDDTGPGADDSSDGSSGSGEHAD